MPLEDLPNGFLAPSRAEIRDRFQRDYALRQPGAPTGQGSQPYIDGSVIADALMPVYANNVSIARSANPQDQTRAQLMAEATALGIPPELPAGAGGGFVTIGASVGGVFIPDTKLLTDDSRNLTFRCALSGTYFDGKAIPVVGVDVGPTTNIPAGTVLTWRSPPPGLKALATVQADSNGDGFTGGRNAEEDADIARRISTARADQPTGGNAAQVRKLVLDAGRDIGIAIQDAFVWPCIIGPGCYAFAFTMRPGDPGTTRVATEIEVAQVLAYITNALPNDDSIIASVIIEQRVNFRLAIDWASDGWVDAQPWPPEDDEWSVISVTDAATFRVQSTATTTPTAPAAGKTVAFYSRSTGTFARKRISAATLVSAGIYDLAIDLLNNSSDTSYLPVIGDGLCPWSPSLNVIVAPLLAQIDLLGPGEQVDDESFFDDGTRQRRIPLDPTEWPSSLRHKTLDPVEELAQVQDMDIISPALPMDVAPGVLGASANMFAVQSILVFPL